MHGQENKQKKRKKKRLLKIRRNDMYMYIKEHPLTKKHEDSQDNLSYSMTKSCHHNNGQTKQHTNQKHSGDRTWNGQPHNTETARVGVELRLNCQQTSRVTLAKQTQFQKKKRNNFQAQPNEENVPILKFNNRYI